VSNSKKGTKRRTGTLRAAIEAVSAEVKESPSYLQDICARNDVLDQHRRRNPVQSTRIIQRKEKVMRFSEALARMEAGEEMESSNGRRYRVRGGHLQYKSETDGWVHSEAGYYACNVYNWEPFDPRSPKERLADAVLSIPSEAKRTWLTPDAANIAEIGYDILVAAIKRYHEEVGE
jgi:hypothetical protein